MHPYKFLMYNSFVFSIVQFILWYLYVFLYALFQHLTNVFYHTGQNAVKKHLHVRRTSLVKPRTVQQCTPNSRICNRDCCLFLSKWTSITLPYLTMMTQWECVWWTCAWLGIQECNVTLQLNIVRTLQLEPVGHVPKLGCSPSTNQQRWQLKQVPDWKSYFEEDDVHVAQHEHHAKQHLHCDTLLSDPFLDIITPLAVTVTVDSVRQGDMNTRKEQIKSRQILCPQQQMF